jgi:predicted RNA binding protein YcfA (HicA-like mRNA interferase family)
MKRQELVRHLLANGCELLREGSRHSVFVNRQTRRSTAIPRHREINDFLAKKICRDLQVPEPGEA